MKLNRVNSKSLCWLIFGGSVAPRGPGAEPIPPGRPAVRLSPQVDSLFWPVVILDQGAGAAFASSQGLGLCAGPPTAPELRPSGSAPSGSRVAGRLQMTCSGRLPRGCREKRGPPLGPISPVAVKYVPTLWSVGTIYKPLYTEIRDTDDRYYHPLMDDRANSKVRMWYVRGELRAGDIRLAFWHHAVLPATRAHDPTLNVGLWARAAGSIVRCQRVSLISHACSP